MFSLCTPAYQVAQHTEHGIPARRMYPGLLEAISVAHIVHGFVCRQPAYIKMGLSLVQVCRASWPNLASGLTLHPAGVLQVVHKRDTVQWSPPP